MTTRQRLATLYAQAAAQGEAAAELADGVSARARVRGERRQLILSRAGAPFGIIELTGLRVAGDVPDHAEVVRYPPTEAGVYRVSLTWEAEPAPATLFDLPAPAAPPAPTPTPEPAPMRGHVWQLLAEGEPLPRHL